MTHSLKFLLFFSLTILLAACKEDEEMTPELEVPTTYAFERDGATTVSFSGQTTRIQMGEELIAAMKDFSISEETLLEMYANETASGEDANPFAAADLNDSDKSIRSKVAASADFFAANTVAAAAIKEDFAHWISAQVQEVFPKQNELAEAGKAGQIADGTSNPLRQRYGAGIQPGGQQRFDRCPDGGSGAQQLPRYGRTGCWR